MLLVQRQASKGGRLPPCPLVAPASLLANWAAEIERFAPDLVARILHPSAMPGEQIKAFTHEEPGGLDLAITSDGMLSVRSTNADKVSEWSADFLSRRRGYTSAFTRPLATNALSFPTNVALAANMAVERKDARCRLVNMPD